MAMIPVMRGAASSYVRLWLVAITDRLNVVA
jgi:hypothetical protein